MNGIRLLLIYLVKSIRNPSDFLHPWSDHRLNSMDTFSNDHIFELWWNDFQTSAFSINKQTPVFPYKVTSLPSNHSCTDFSEPLWNWDDADKWLTGTQWKPLRLWEFLPFKLHNKAFYIISLLSGVYLKSGFKCQCNNGVGVLIKCD